MDFAYFEHPDFAGHERTILHCDTETGLQAIIAVHNTVRGPALGGCRMFPYANTADALTDALRLSRGMTYKAAFSLLPLGGGKMVIIGDPKTIKTSELLRSAGRFVDSLNGAYITGEDMGMTSEDCRVMAETTPYVGGIVHTKYDGDPSPVTAYGVECAIRAALKVVRGTYSLKGVKCAIEGVGHVGHALAHLLHRRGAILFVSDVDQGKLVVLERELPIQVMDTESLRKASVDVYVPCARGAVVNDETVGAFQAPIICGSANNILDRPEHGQMLWDRGIFCVPDYVANSGGLIDIYYQRAGYDERAVRKHVHRITYGETKHILFSALREQCTPQSIADRIAEERFARTK